MYNNKEGWISKCIDACKLLVLFLIYGWLAKIYLPKTIKTSHEDPLPGCLFYLNELLPALTLLVNQSLSTGSMEGLKNSVITKILKKTDSDPEMLKNYRPVCNTLYLSKTIEQAVIVQANYDVQP